ncbi:FAD-dependent oxidoreductase [Limnochorda pilosa]|uniref:FAD-dependent oxidoreductase n=1 Tax=Limnochorda pilosa TaxID=1555112 RepID=A0A0K2SHU6_LIMPI|nr:FAD-dependent oxidoreductase [Limnochorda pilosa]
MQGRRAAAWARLDETWDLIVIGGGIVGVGILREAVRAGLRAVLFEQRDFAWGTSSRSGRLVHGGIRYLKQGQVRLTRDSVRERERLLRDAPGLVQELPFLLPVYRGDHPGKTVYGVGLELYDRLGGLQSHRYLNAEAFSLAAPHVQREDLEGGFLFRDAQTDDARLVLRVLREAMGHGALALNYARVEELLEDEDGNATGVVVRDVSGEDAPAFGDDEGIHTGQERPGSGGRGAGAARTARVRARAVVNATGAWADHLREQVSGRRRLRPLRGSHLIFPGWRLPLGGAVSLIHPWDHRPLYAFPWEGVTLVGTTDVDHATDLNREAAISPEETGYLMAAVQHAFPRLGLALSDVRSSYAGVRPVVGTGKADPSKESREHALWLERGLLTVTGGKLTTFRLMALQALERLRSLLPEMPPLDPDAPVLDPVSAPAGPMPGRPGLGGEGALLRLSGRYGAEAGDLLEAAEPGELEPAEGTATLWAELRWAARKEDVVHLDDLLLRRVRVGVLLEEGALPLMERIRAVVQPELGWNDRRWAQEAERYAELWRRCYAPPREVAGRRPQPPSRPAAGPSSPTSTPPGATGAGHPEDHR